MPKKPSDAARIADDSKLAHIYLAEIEDGLERRLRPFDGSIAFTAK